MGCITRYQWCKNDGKICTALTGNSVGGRNAFKKAIPEELRLNSRQRAIFNRMYSYAWSTYPPTICCTLLYDVRRAVAILRPNNFRLRAELGRQYISTMQLLLLSGRFRDLPGLCEIPTNVNMQILCYTILRVWSIPTHCLQQR